MNPSRWLVAAVLALGLVACATDKESAVPVEELAERVRRHRRPQFRSDTFFVERHAIYFT